MLIYEIQLSNLKEYTNICILIEKMLSFISIGYHHVSCLESLWLLLLLLKLDLGLGLKVWNKSKVYRSKLNKK